MSIVISIVSYPFLPARTGGEKGVALFNKYFSKFHEFVCVTVHASDPAAASYDVFNILSDKKWRYINIFYFFTLRNLIRQKKATHVLIEHPYYGWLGWMLKIFCGVRLIVHSHNMEGLRWKALGKWWWPMLWHYERLTHRAANYNFFIHDLDKAYAIEQFGLSPSKCLTMTYGIEWDKIPLPADRARASLEIRTRHQIPKEKKILLFNGAFHYKPNLDALKKITDAINPRLSVIPDFSYCLVICGINIPSVIASTSYPNIIWAGFVEDIGEYFKGADIFLNPITEGGGIKTKLVEALGYNLNAVSTDSGAIGVDPAWCNGKLRCCLDGDWKRFTDAVTTLSGYAADTPAVYYDHFYWGYTTKRAAEFIA